MNKITQTLLTLIALFATGCAQQEILPSEDPAELTQTAMITLDNYVYLNELINQCSRLGDDAEYEALTAQQDWLAKNWANVVAADEYYSQQFLSSTKDYDDKKLSLEAIWLKHQARSRAISELNLKQRTSGNQQKVCIRRMQAIAKNAVEPGVAAQTQANLQALATKHDRDTRRITEIPTLAGSFDLDLATGSSYYVLAENLKKECSQAAFIVIENQWPNEAYASYCDQAPVSLIQCQWGQCSEAP
jgi:hypothetical protein